MTRTLGRDAGGALVAVFGALMVRLVLEGAHRRYVRTGMGPFLVAAGLAAVALGVVTLMRRRTDDHDHDHAPDSGHSGLDVGWLLLAPVLVLVLVAPPALGSFSLSRSSAPVTVERGDASFAALDPGQAHPMAVLEFTQRAADADARSLNGARVQLTGFVGGDGDRGFLVARYSIACCAADAAPAVVDVVGWDGPVPDRDTWVTVTGRFEPGGDPVPLLAADTVVPVPTPDEPYE